MMIGGVTVLALTVGGLAAYDRLRDEWRDREAERAVVVEQVASEIYPAAPTGGLRPADDPLERP